MTDRIRQEVELWCRRWPHAHSLSAPVTNDLLRCLTAAWEEERQPSVEDVLVDAETERDMAASAYADSACEVTRLQQQLAAAQAQVAALTDARTGLWKLIEDRTLVRDIARDHEPGWARRQIPLLHALQVARDALATGRDGGK